MAHVVLHCAEFPSSEKAIAAAAELETLKAALVAWEVGNFSDGKNVPMPCLEFAERRAFEWPPNAVVLLEHPASEIEVVQVDALVFFYGGGFDLGGAGTARFFEYAGATRCATSGHLVIDAQDPVALTRELASFLDEEDFADQYRVFEGKPPAPLMHSITLTGPGGPRVLGFDDSGVQDWAFVALLPQLDGSRPRFGRR